MRFMRLGEPGAEIPVVTDGTTTWDLRPLTTDIDGAFLADDGLTRAEAAAGAGDLPELDPAGLRIGAPIARPQAVICIGMNYAAHARESGSEPPTDIVVFYKHPNTVVGPNDDILLPPGSTTTDWEVELAVVIGKRARYLDSPEQAIDHIAGFAVANDVSEREYQLQRSLGQWSKGKSFETFNPLGPWLVPAAEVGDGSGLGIRSRVNGESRQDSNTSDLIFNVAEIVYRLSRFTVLQPGDLINTGTPEGVGLSGRFPYLAAGDEVEVEVDGLGAQRSTVRPAL
ncbi:2-keto-4-pentenoate hydratase/2-oxohepta-3-ene-1,7-dioic acid hydratase (catechol pathway) [Leifsonia sp. 98AMF]|uniref:fumarylacetoacetate hydrolase family protein n=1 Tax=unclassified Leifsonia TaxID=2663824 RepID=UPI00087A3F50|nr:MULTISPECIES: fumarylacetoacetate hydrolase family protein [unclassified Leifsonia]SDH10965.1 2-keto-4-pentenoate hydratase/2-oxohepta-3-ene-1,7-dioic acid hydratase (catechol pathway) [Leifsonia sp. 197AMF]SDJ27807.1 2-keto-4-pentenoate hydratase/2-oxohepta-3-ene-1,7-dioic acid hydratase (catechol pathway) [Leifsonia sp. 466MF]SDK53192.1 2-keto-4-pentenoate hydratase/2-oxohepta-3-ene-1,7-dioic acid hydratase (catechol pathway) [Leifsonia sp. 157MF]SDN49878.1 2-keto-4-pentenoate hydratase/2-